MIIYDKKKILLGSIKEKIDPNIMRIEFIFDTTPSNFNVEVADLKYDKDFAYSIEMDDGYSDAYQNVFSMFYGEIPDLTGRTWSGYTYTDGCGNEVMYNASFGGYLVNSDGTDGHLEDQNSYIKWSQYEFGTDFGFDVYFHGWGQPDITTANESGYTYDIYLSAVTLSDDRYWSKIRKRHLTGTRPNGVNSYVNKDGKCALFEGGIKSFGVDVGSSITVAGVSRTVDTIGVRCDNLTNDDFTNGIIFNRPIMTTEYGTGATITNINTAASNQYPRWVTNYTHRVNYGNPISASITVSDFEKIMNYIDTNYGKNGADNIWVCGAQEFIEYQHAKLNSVVTTSYEGRKVIVTVEYPTGATYLNYTRRPCLTLKFSCNNEPTQLNTYNIPKFSNNVTGSTTGIVNIEWSTEFEDVADKYVTKAEVDRTQSAIDFAQYLINRISDYDIRNPLQTRLNDVEVLTTRVFLIDLGQSGFYEQTKETSNTQSPVYNMEWNNLTGSTTASNDAFTTTMSAYRLRDTSGTYSNYGFTITESFYGLNTQGMSITASGVTDLYPYKAFHDSLSTHSTNTGGTFKLTGLLTGSTYDLSFSGCRWFGGANYNTIVTVSGHTPVSYQAYNNATLEGIVTDITPNSSGEIYVSVTSNESQGILGVIKITEYS